MRSTKLPSWLEGLFGLEPRLASPNVFLFQERALVFGRFEKADDGVVLRESAAFDLGPDAFQEGPLGGPLREPETFKGQLQELLGGLEASPESATLVVPDRWLRLVFAEITDLPDSPQTRSEVLRFKLRRLVPFRVEDLRIEGVEVPPLEGQDEPRRVLISFAAEALLGQIEQLFEAVGVRLGLVTNETLSVAAAVPGDGLVATVLALQDGYSLYVRRDGEPVLYRHKALEQGLALEILASIVARDMRLTRSFLDEKLPAPERGEIWIAADEAGPWSEWIEQGLGEPPRALDLSALATAASLPRELADLRGALLLGGSMQEVT